MKMRYSRLWLASILLSSVVTGGGSFALLAMLTELPISIVVAISAALVLLGDVLLALLMQAVAPTRVTLGPGDRRRNTELPKESGTVATSFDERRGRVAIRGENWGARQAVSCSGRLETGAAVRIVDREGLTLVVSAME